MDFVSFFISLVGLVVAPTISYFGMRGTILDISNFKENPWPILWYYDLFLVLIPPVIVNAYGVQNIPIFYLAVPGEERLVTLVVFFTITIYIFSLMIFLRVFGLDNKGKNIELKSYIYNDFFRLALILTIFGFFVVVFFYMLGYKHAFMEAFLNKQSVMVFRLGNKYSSKVPSQLTSILPLTGYILAIISGYIARKNIRVSLFFLCVSLLFASMPGDKAPVMITFLLFFLSYKKFLNKKFFSIKTLFLIIIIFIPILYFIVSFQIPNLTLKKFFDYIFLRIGIGQMAGVYETFGLILKNSFPSGDFFWHMIPGSKFFVSYIDFQKTLMMITEGCGFSEMGVKNTYFIAEAYAVGRIPVLFLSPIIVAFSTSFGIYLLKKYLDLLFRSDITKKLSLTLYILTHSITGGFSQYVFFKGLMLLIIHLSFLLIFKIIINDVFFKRNRVFY